MTLKSCHSKSRKTRCYAPMTSQKPFRGLKGKTLKASKVLPKTLLFLDKKVDEVVHDFLLNIPKINLKFTDFNQAGQHGED